MAKPPSVAVPPVARGLWLVGTLLGAIGWWLPWVVDQKGAAALVLLGLDLGDFWKFTAAWRAGLLEWERLCFFLPPLLAALLLTLWIAGERSRWRWIFAPIILFLAVVILPAFDSQLLPAVASWFPPRFANADMARQFSAQLYGSLVGVAALVAVPLWQRLAERWRAALSALLALLAAALPSWAMWMTWPTVQSLYGGGAQVGAGLWATVAGFVVAALGALWVTLVGGRHRSRADSS